MGKFKLHSELQNIYENALANINDASYLKSYFELLSRMPEESYVNCLLIHEQLPKASIILESNAWNEIGYNVQKQELPIKYLNLFYSTKENSLMLQNKPAYLYDISQLQNQNLVLPEGYNETEISVESLSKALGINDTLNNEKLTKEINQVVHNKLLTFDLIMTGKDIDKKFIENYTSQVVCKRYLNNDIKINYQIKDMSKLEVNLNQISNLSSQINHDIEKRVKSLSKQKFKDLMSQYNSNNKKLSLKKGKVFENEI